MIRENMYLFRGRRMRDNKWLYGNFRYNPTENLTWIAVPKGMYDAVDIVYPNTVCQYTGLTDKNGVKVFENDIVKQIVHNGDIRFGAVEFDNGAFSVRWSDKTYGLDFAGYVPDLEVIGNIHDNHPEGDSHA